jgi:hypothetical protein
MLGGGLLGGCQGVSSSSPGQACLCSRRQRADILRSKALINPQVRCFLVPAIIRAKQTL